MKQLFELSTYDWEDNNTWLFYHDELKTEEDFEKDVKNTLLKYGQEYVDSESSWVGINEWVQYAADRLNELGYIEVKPVRRIINSTAIIERDDDVKRWSEWVGKDLSEKAAIKNKALNEKIMNSI